MAFVLSGVALMDEADRRHLAELRQRALTATVTGQHDVADGLHYRIDCIERGRPDPGAPPDADQ